MTPEPITASPLAASMQPVIDAVGFDAALALVSRLGGTRVMVPEQPHWRDPLCAVIGLDKAAALVQALGAGPLEVPRCTAWMLARRNEEIVNRRLAGESQAELALRFCLTERHIRNILAEEPTRPACLPPKEATHET